MGGVCPYFRVTPASLCVQMALVAKRDIQPEGEGWGASGVIIQGLPKIKDTHLH